MMSPTLRAIVLLAGALAGCDTAFGLERQIDAAPDQPPQVCPASYTQTGGSYYRVVTTPATWLEAEQTCISDGAGLGMSTHLAVTGTITEVNDVYDLVHAQKDDYAWIGMSNRADTPTNCTDPPDPGFEWVTDEQVPVPAAHQPPWNSLDPMLVCEQQCVRILLNPQLDNSSCGNLHSYVCECDAHPDDPARR